MEHCRADASYAIKVLFRSLLKIFETTIVVQITKFFFSFFFLGWQRWRQNADSHLHEASAPALSYITQPWFGIESCYVGLSYSSLLLPQAPEILNHHTQQQHYFSQHCLVIREQPQWLLVSGVTGLLDQREPAMELLESHRAENYNQCVWLELCKAYVSPQPSS